VGLPTLCVFAVVLTCDARFSACSVGRLMGRASWSHSNFPDHSSLYFLDGSVVSAGLLPYFLEYSAPSNKPRNQFFKKEKFKNYFFFF
jgi:hypothetical protein